MYSAAHATNGRLSLSKRSRWNRLAIAAIHTNMITAGNPAATARHGAPNVSRPKKYAPPAYTEPSVIAVTSGLRSHAHSVFVRPG